MEDALARISERDGRVRAFLCVDRDGALRRAEELQERIDRGEDAGLLAGVPLAVKDNICTAGLRTGCASRILEDFVPPYDATAVEKLRAAGAVILGKTNMDEFGMGSTTEFSAYAPTANPLKEEHVPGGSSGGSAAAVAANMCAFALGSDTGGSIRQPASHCGVVGVKPSYGRVSRFGLVAYASSLEQIGVLARNVSDAAAVLELISGRDARDAGSLNEKAGFTGALSGDARGLRIGLLEDCFADGLSEAVGRRVREAAEAFRAAGAQVESCVLPGSEHMLAVYYTIAMAEASSNLGRYDGVKYGYRSPEYADLKELVERSRSEGFGPEVKRRILLGTYVLSAGCYEEYYHKALRLRQRIREAYDEAFSSYDLLLGPVSPTTAPKLGEAIRDPQTARLADLYTVGANLAGIPAISVPCGFDGKGLPVGLQLQAPYLREDLLFRAAHAHERIRGNEAWEKKDEA